MKRMIDYKIATVNGDELFGDSSGTKEGEITKEEIAQLMSLDKIVLTIEDEEAKVTTELTRTRKTVMSTLDGETVTCSMSFSSVAFGESGSIGTGHFLNIEFSVGSSGGDMYTLEFINY